MNLKDFNKNNIIINDKIKNKVLTSSDFYRIIYSDEYHSTSGIFVTFTLRDVILEKYFNKVKCLMLNRKDNQYYIDLLEKIEKTVMDKYYNSTKKKPVYRISEQLNQHFIKLYGNDRLELKKYDEIHFLLKISGIWDSDETKDYGLTFRFFIFNSLF